MESPPRKLIVGQDRADRISALTDHLLLDILERLDLREAVRAGALSTRWRHLPNHFSRVHLDIAQFQGATPLEAMDAFTSAARALLAVVPPAEGQCESGALKVLVLSLYTSSPHLSSIGRLVEDIVSLGQTECLEFYISSPPGSNTDPQLAEIGQQFMSFSCTYPVAFWWLTGLTLKKLVFGYSDITDLISACGRLRYLKLSFCRLVDLYSALKIDVPRSGIQELRFIGFCCERIDLISVPKLRTMLCYYWRANNPPLHFGSVPNLHQLKVCSRAKRWQAPFTLSECLSRGASSLSKLSLNFYCQMIWIQPENPRKLTSIFSNLTDVHLSGIFPECDLSWTLFIMEAAPTLQNFVLYRTRLCAKPLEYNAEKTNVVWGPSRDFKHFNLKRVAI